MSVCLRSSCRWLLLVLFCLAFASGCGSSAEVAKPETKNVEENRKAYEAMAQQERMNQ